MNFIIGLIAFIIILGVIILIHEGGHFFFARRANILCHEFSIGMGPIIWKKKKGETVYGIRCIPIGGFVSMAGEEVEQDFLKSVEKVKLEFDENNRVKRIICDVDNELFVDLPEYTLVKYDILGTMEALPDELYLTVKKPAKEGEEVEEETYIVNRDAMMYFSKKEEYQIAPLDRNFATKSIGARFMTVFAGPMMNFILAILIYLVIGIVQGYPNTASTKLDSINKDDNPPVYTTIEGDTGLRGGEIITHINGKEVKEWADVSTIMAELASGKNNSFNGLLKIDYTDTNGNSQTKTFAPAVSIFSIELMLDMEASKNNKVVVGTYSNEETNKKTKSYLAGLRTGDIITKLTYCDYEVEVNTLNDILAFFDNDKLEEDQKSSGCSCSGSEKKVTVTYTRDEKVDQKAEISLYSKQMLDSQGITRTKVQLGITPEYKFDILKTLYMPFVNTGSSAIGIFKTLGLLFTDSTVNIDDFSGPVGIFSLVTNTAKEGILSLLSLTAFLSVNIGFVNLLPLPALDGGRLVFIIYEGITKKKPSPKVENMVHTIGFLLLMGLFVIISFSDILRLVGCK